MASILHLIHCEGCHRSRSLWSELPRRRDGVPPVGTEGKERSSAVDPGRKIRTPRLRNATTGIVGFRSSGSGRGSRRRYVHTRNRCAPRRLVLLHGRQRQAIAGPGIAISSGRSAWTERDCGPEFVPVDRPTLARARILEVCHLRIARGDIHAGRYSGRRNCQVAVPERPRCYRD
jgi:hypothetical protein